MPAPRRGGSWDDALWGYDLASGDPGSFDTRDSAPFMAKGIVEDPQFDWEGDKAMRRPWSETIIYEAHVRGLTMQHPGVPEALRGTYAGMSCDAILEHLTRLGVTAIELLPCQFFLDDRMLIDKGLSNYWGYQTLGFFAPEVRYLAEGELAPSPSASSRIWSAASTARGSRSSWMWSTTTPPKDRNAGRH
jgi:glycogen operon protein